MAARKKFGHSNGGDTERRPGLKVVPGTASLWSKVTLLTRLSCSFTGGKDIMRPWAQGQTELQIQALLPISCVTLWCGATIETRPPSQRHCGQRRDERCIFK